MNKPALADGALTPTDWTSPAMVARIRQRYAREARFKAMGLVALVISALFLAFLLYSIAGNGLTGFQSTEIRLNVAFKPEALGITAADLAGPDAEDRLRQADYGLIGGDALIARFPEVTDPGDQMDLEELLSPGTAAYLRETLVDNPALLGKSITLWVPAATDVDMLNKGQIDADLPALERGISDRMLGYYRQLKADGDIRTSFNTRFFTAADSRDPELAAIWGATMGSLLTLFVTLLISFPVGVLAAVYLEEYAPKNRLTDFIEVNINNLAAVPSIIFGLLGLAVFLGTFGMQRSAPVVGGLTLALMTLPTIVIASRVAIKAVPPSIRDAARGIGASPLQVVFHHVVPLALPGIMTGTIIGMARALGETAPLLMIGMRAFVVDVPASLTDPATVLPVQVFLWSDSVERGFVEKTSAAIIVLMVFLLMMNALAIYLRQKFERRW
ncbi:phosphate ABC transporter permease PstA [Parapedomonas caeni]